MPWLSCIYTRKQMPFDAEPIAMTLRDFDRTIRRKMTETFSNKKNMGLRGSGAYRADNGFDIARRVGGGKALDLRSEPPNETDRALTHSRELLARLRVMMLTPR